MKAFEDATGEALPEDKKELATEELITTGDLGDDIGQDKATGVINDIKTEIIKNGTNDTIQIAETINNITNNYNVTLSDEQIKKIEDLMTKIAQQNYDYNKVKDTLGNVSDNVDKNLEELGESIKNSGILDTIKDWFNGVGEWFSNLFTSDKDLGILENTNDNLLGSDAKIDATDDKAINIPSSEEVEGFFAKIWNWFTGLFNTNDSNKVEDNNTLPVEESSNDSNKDTTVDSLEQSPTVDENVEPDTSVENQPENLDTTNDAGSVDELNTPDSNTLQEQPAN